MVARDLARLIKAGGLAAMAAALMVGGCGFASCASPSEERRDQVETAQGQMFGPSSSRRQQRVRNVTGH